MLVPLLLAVLASPGSPHCLDSFLGIGAHQQRPARAAGSGHVAATAGSRIDRIDRVVSPPGETIGFLYATTDGGRFFGTRTRAHEPSSAAPYVRAIFLRDALVPRSQLDRILASQDGNAILYVPNEKRLFSKLKLQRSACVSRGASA